MNQPLTFDKSEQCSPDLAGAPDFDFQRSVLVNGLVVLLHPAPQEHDVTVTMGYRVGSKNEKAGQTGSAHLFEHLMFSGSANLPEVWSETMKGVGATNVNAFTTPDLTCYHQTLPPGALEFALWAEADRMGSFRDSLTEASLRKEQSIVLAEKAQREGGPMGHLHERVLECMYPEGHPYRHPVIGSVQDISGMTLADARDWHRRYYAPDNAVLMVSGPIDASSVLHLARQHFEHILPCGEDASPPSAWVPDTSPRRREHIASHLLDYNQLELIWPVPELTWPQAPLLQALTDLLGNSELTPLHKALVEPGLALSVAVVYEPGDVCGLIKVVVTLPPETPPSDVVASVRAALAQALNDCPDEESFLRLRRQVELSVEMQATNASAQANLLFRGEMAGRDPLLYRQELRTLAAASAAQTWEIGRQWLGREPFMLEVERDPAVPERGTAPRPARPSVTASPREPREAIWTEEFLHGGLKLVQSTRQDAPDVVLKLELALGNGSESEPERGYCTLLSSLPFHGLGKRSTQELRALTQETGIDLVCGSTVSHFSIEISSPARSAEIAAELLEDLVLHRRFDAKTFADLKSKQQRDLAESKADGLGLALRGPRARLYGPTSREMRDAGGLPMSLESATPDDVLAFADRLFDPFGAVLFVTGSEATVARTRLRLAGLADRWVRPGNPLAPWPSEPMPSRTEDRIFFAPVGPGDQAVIQLAMILPPLEDHAKRELARAAAAIVQRRLGDKLREDRGWTYGVGAGVVDAETEGLPPCMSVSTSVTAAHAAEAVAEIRLIMGELLHERPVTDAEMDEHRQQAIAALFRATASTGNLAFTVHASFRIGESAPIRRRLDAVMAMRAEHVTHFLERVFALGPAEWVVASTDGEVKDWLQSSELAIVQEEPVR